MGAFLYYLLLYFAYAHADGLEVIALQYTWPILIVIFSIFLLKEKITKKSVLASILGFLGVIFVLTKGAFNQIHLDNIGVNLIALIAASVFALFSVLSKKFNLEPFTGTTIFFFLQQLVHS